MKTLTERIQEQMKSKEVSNKPVVAIDHNKTMGGNNSLLDNRSYQDCVVGTDGKTYFGKAIRTE